MQLELEIVLPARSIRTPDFTERHPLLGTLYEMFKSLGAIHLVLDLLTMFVAAMVAVIALA